MGAGAGAGAALLLYAGDILCRAAAIYRLSTANAVQYKPVQCSQDFTKVQGSACSLVQGVKYSVKHSRSVQCSTVQLSVVPCSAVQCSAMQCSTVQHGEECSSGICKLPMGQKQ